VHLVVKREIITKPDEGWGGRLGSGRFIAGIKNVETKTGLNTRGRVKVMTQCNGI
jgi:hypothetical protein